MSDRETIEAYDTHVGAYADLASSESEHATLIRFIEICAREGRVLDLGCGPGHGAATMRKHGLDVDPIDASEEMVRLANETYAVGARRAEFSDVSGRDIYDGVWANFSLLHAPRDGFADHLRRIQRVLRPRGVFHIAMKLGSGTARDKLGRLYTYYSEAELVTHLEAAGFAMIELARGEGMGLAGDIEPWIAITTRSVPETDST